MGASEGAESFGTRGKLASTSAPTPGFRGFRLQDRPGDGSILGIRGDRILSIPGGQVRQVFLATMVVWLVSGLETIASLLQSPAASL